MCKVSNYPKEYYRATELLRVNNIKPGIGQELLKKAIVMYNVKYIKPCASPKSSQNWRRKGKPFSKWNKRKPRDIDQQFLDELKKGMVIPSNKELSGKLEEINRDPAMQWMIETLKCSNIIKDQTKKEKEQHKADLELAVKHFIIKNAEQL